MAKAEQAMLLRASRWSDTVNAITESSREPIVSAGHWCASTATSSPSFPTVELSAILHPPGARAELAVPSSAKQSQPHSCGKYQFLRLAELALQVEAPSAK